MNAYVLVVGTCWNQQVTVTVQPVVWEGFPIPI